jgi:hypothetical protein
MRVAALRGKTRKKEESADKPGSVLDNHSSGTPVTGGLKQPTRKRPRARHMLPYLVLLQVGFTVPRSVATRAVRSYRTISPLPSEEGGIFSVALSVGSRPPGVTWHPSRRSPDFPPNANIERLPGRLRAQA